MRVFPISNWTELDVWQYIAEEELEVPSIYFAHEREVFARDGMLYAYEPARAVDRGRAAVRGVGAVPHGRGHELYRGGRVAGGDAAGGSAGDRRDTQITERGQTRADDRVTEAAMEDRKRKGYF